MALFTKRFDYTGSVQKLTIPPNIKKVYLEAYGAVNGGCAKGWYRFKEGDSRELQIYVGGNKGWNGGGRCSYSNKDYGGDASDVRLNGNTLYDRIITAGGGGIGSTYINGVTYNAGGGGGLSGEDSPYNQYGGQTATGGTQTSGGLGGTYNNGGKWGQGHDGSFGIGGNGYCGGGGGWYGGGGGGFSNTAGGSSHIAYLEQGETYSNVNKAIDGYIIVSYVAQTILLEKEGQYFSISKDYFDTDTLSFRSVHLSSDDLPNVELKTLNNPIEINGVSYIPSDYIDFSEYKICIVDFLKDKEKNIITVNYNLSETSLNKAEIKIKDKFKTEENYHTKITGSNTQYIKYKYYPEDTEYLDTENIGDRIYEKDFYMYFKFINQDCILNNIIGYGALNNKFELLKTKDVDIFKDFYKGKIYIRFKKDYEYNVNINYLTKENAVLINNESLEEVK